MLVKVKMDYPQIVLSKFMDSKIIIVDVDLLVPYENIVRQCGKRKIKKVAESLQQHGFINPILIADNKIVVGYERVEAAKLLQIKKVPAVSLSHLTDEQIKQYAIVSRRLAVTEHWDKEALKDYPDVDLNLLGFDDYFTLATEDVASAKPQQLALCVACEDELEQAALYDELIMRGYKVNLLR